MSRGSRENDLNTAPLQDEEGIFIAVLRSSKTSTTHIHRYPAVNKPYLCYHEMCLCHSHLCKLQGKAELSQKALRQPLILLPFFSKKGNVKKQSEADLHLTFRLH